MTASLMTTTEPIRNTAAHSNSLKPNAAHAITNAVTTTTTRKSRDCTKYVTLPEDCRLSIDRDCFSFKKIYALRTEAERYNARFKQTGQERLWGHGFKAAQNMNSVAHIDLA